MAQPPKVQHKNFWDQADMQGALTRPVSQEDIDMLRAQWPFLELISWRDAVPTDEGDAPTLESLAIPEGNQASPCLLHAEGSGWPIQYWVGNADYATTMSSSTGQHVFGGKDDAAQGQGTTSAQAFATAVAMIKLAKTQSWPGVQILSGSENMAWAAWAACEAMNLPCMGYTPNPEAYARAERVQHLIDAQSMSAAPAKAMGPGGFASSVQVDVFGETPSDAAE